MDAETNTAIESFHGQEYLPPAGVSERHGGRLLQQLTDIFEALHDRGIHCNSIRLDDIILRDEYDMRVILNGIPRLLLGQPVSHGKIAPVDRDFDLRNLAQLVISAIQGDERGRSPSREVVCDPIWWELLSLLQSAEKTAIPKGALGSYVRSLRCGEFEQPFTMARLRFWTFVRFTHCADTGTLLLCAKDIALLFERQARRNRNISKGDLETIGRVRRECKRSRELNEDEELNHEAYLSLDVVLTLALSGITDSQNLRDQLQQRHRKSPMRIETTFQVPCIRDTGLVNATQMQERMGKTVRLSAFISTSKIQEVRGRADSAGIYVHHNLLPKKRSFRFDVAPTTLAGSALTQQLGALNSQEYVIFDTESCGSSRLMTMHRGQHRAKWGFQAGSLSGMERLSRPLSLDESRSICDQFGFIQTKRAIDQFVAAASKSLPSRLVKPEPLSIDDPSGSDTDIEVRRQDPLKFKRRTYRNSPTGLPSSTAQAEG